MLFRTFLLAGLTAAAIRPALAHDCQPYQPEPVALTGEITLVHGPKGPKDDYYLLTLPEMVCVAGGTAETDEDVESINALQLQLPKGVKLGPSLLGRRVSVTGTLVHRLAEGHTDVLLTYDTAKPAP
ncbi:hypothetical protein [Nitrospirillum iridis]|uniref:DUF4431 domain-containing protein n=1 Tax=Nitrospirillum iridis TaxID=765888 RepID=A0A7X0ECC2_9PROT|nr:hypothetical protein [Nitrospirillum iridis]MBB6251488.1 hypothetical protein [Nitrospirillum iridis]